MVGLYVDLSWQTYKNSIYRRSLIKAVFLMSLLLDKGVYSSNQVESEEILSYEFSDYECKTLKHIYSKLDNESRKKFVDLENAEVTAESFSQFYKQLIEHKALEGFEELDLSGIENCKLPERLFQHMVNLKTLKVSGNTNINLKSAGLEILCPQLEELNISNCNINDEVFSIICKCARLLKLDISGNPKINLSNQNISFLKATVRELSIDNCDLETDDMKKITQFQSLGVLSISNNFLRKFFQSSGLGKLCKTLISLKASNVGLKSLRKIRTCNNLQFLDVSCNNLAKKTKCNFLGDLKTKLIRLNLSRTSLEPNQLAEILDSSSIEELDCSFNNFSDFKKDNFKFGQAKETLKIANFARCKISLQFFLEELFSCKLLEKADLSNNKFRIDYDNFSLESTEIPLTWLDISNSNIVISSFIFKILEKFEKLEYLDLSYSFFRPQTAYPMLPKNANFNSGTEISTMENLKKSLKIVKMSCCLIENNIRFLQELTNCESLEYLDISNNSFNQLPKTFEFGASKKPLKYLNMNNCVLSDSCLLDIVTNLEVLETLSINYNCIAKISETFEFKKSKETLKVLAMAECHLESLNILTSIAQCKSLESLDLSSNQPPVVLEKMSFGAARKTLININMSNCNIISRYLLEAVTDCPKLKILDLYDCNLEELFEDFTFGASKESLEVLNMSKCRLKGAKILSAITDCKNLKELYLSDNNFEGDFVNFSFGASKGSLKVLEMENCKMKSPNIFVAITSCEVLEKLSLSKNCFSCADYGFILGASKNTLKDLSISNLKFENLAHLYMFFDCPKLEKIDISTYLDSDEEKNLTSDGQNPENPDTSKRFCLDEKESLIFDLFGSSKKTLKRLIAINCGITKPSSLYALTSFPKLEFIDISQNHFERFPKNFKLGDSRNTLIEIKAIDCFLKDKNIIEALTNCKQLESLVLDKNALSGKVNFGISKLSLKALSLADCKIQPKSWIEEIKKCPKIRKLDFSKNDLRKITNEFNCPSFRNSIVELNISDCQIENNLVLRSLTKYHRLESLKIDMNDLSMLKYDFDFGNLSYKLVYFSIAKCKLKLSVKMEIKASFISSRDVKL